MESNEPSESEGDGSEEGARADAAGTLMSNLSGT